MKKAQGKYSRLCHKKVLLNIKIKGVNEMPKGYKTKTFTSFENIKKFISTNTITDYYYITPMFSENSIILCYK